jgi:enhancing lycopene biosynthesis protein 2
MACIAPILAARIFGTKNGGKGCKVTLGEDVEYKNQVEGYGSTFESAKVNEVVVDKANLFVSTPAYMDEGANQVQVFDAIGKMVQETIKLTGSESESGKKDFSFILSGLKNAMKPDEFQKLEKEFGEQK